jgi:hypothetical protein
MLAELLTLFVTDQYPKLAIGPYLLQVLFALAGNDVLMLLKR